ncbi:HNH endonuclease [Mycolicibacterium senegalense]|uniref:HNH endonuclease n=1 Tax=Mycolicibacterium senegalense TaxID=1796 RepID=UPI003AAFC070
MADYPAVLVLNATYEALDLVSWENAIVLLVKDKATVHRAHESGALIRSAQVTIPLPAVIVLTHYVFVPYREPDDHAGTSMAAILRRDNFACGYCGDFATTVDHVVPRSRSGPNTFANLVAACLTCNQLKADLTPEEAGMRLLWTPRAPSRSPVRQRHIWRELSTTG